MIDLDPITLKVIWDRLVTICQDAAATMVRTTFSPVVRESNDYCCSLIDAKGRQLAEPPHTIPAFTGSLPFTVRHFLRRFPLDGLEPGDSILTNDPWLGTGQLNDFNVATPIFDSRGSVIAIASSTAHMTDIGGSANFGLVQDIHEEGLRIPITKVVRGGELDSFLVELIRANVRMPDQCMGDLTGMLASNRTMGSRLIEVVEDSKIEDFAALGEAILDRTEASMRAAIADIPNGQYEGVVTFGGPGADITIKAHITVSDHDMRIDFAGSSPQIANSSINVAMNYTYSYTVYPLKLLIHPRLPSNDGSLRPLHIDAPAGSILNSQWPAAGYHRSLVGHMIHAALFSALEGAIPYRVWAHSGSAPACIESLSGIGNTGDPFVYLFFAAGGGTGAMPMKDGVECFFPTNISATSIESTESLTPVMFERKEVIPDSAGAGTHRGGLGGRWTIRNVGKVPVKYSGQVGRLHHPARGLLGGESGRLSYLFIDGQAIEDGWATWELEPGATFTKESPGGGGLKSPLERKPELVLSDVLDGYVTLDQAEAAYGLVIENGRITGSKRRSAGAVSSSPADANRPDRS